MSSRLQPYTIPSAVRSSLFRSQSEAVPPLEELESLESELKVLRQKTLERAKKAGDDLKTIEESMRRAKEKAKGKAKAMERVNRDSSCAYLHTPCATTLTLSLFALSLLSRDVSNLFATAVFARKKCGSCSAVVSYWIPSCDAISLWRRSFLAVSCSYASGRG